LELLEATFLNCLLYANDVLEARSIALPAISAGVFGVLIHIVALAIRNATRIFDRYLTTLLQDRKFVAHIKIANPDDRIVEMLAAEIGSKIGQTDRRHAQIDDSSVQRSYGLGQSYTCSADTSDGAASTKHAEQSADQPADSAAGPWTHQPPHALIAHEAQRAILDRHARAHSNYRYDNENAISTIKSDILQKYTNTTENIGGQRTEDKSQAYASSTVHEQATYVISTGDTAPPVTADYDGHVRGRHALSGRDDSQTGSTSNAEDRRTKANAECGDDSVAALNLQTQQQDTELANIINYLQRGKLSEENKIARRIALTKDQFVIHENVLYHLCTNRRKNNSNQQITEQICIPKHMTGTVLARYHAQLMHCGYEKMYLQSNPFISPLVISPNSLLANTGRGTDFLSCYLPH